MTRQVMPTHAIACCYRRTDDDGLEIVTVRSRSGRWTLPKGHVEPGESPAQAAAREAREEAGVDGVLDPEPILWVRLAPGRHGRKLARSYRAPVYALLVGRQHPPLEPWRTPRWWSMRDGGAARALRRPWPFDWRCRSVAALARRVIP